MTAGATVTDVEDTNLLMIFLRNGFTNHNVIIGWIHGCQFINAIEIDAPASNCTSVKNINMNVTIGIKLKIIGKIA